MVGASANFPLHFFHTYIIQGKQGTEFAHCAETVKLDQGFDRTGDLPFDVPFGNIYRLQLPLFAFLLTFRRMQSVFLFQKFGNLLAAAVFELVGNLPSLTVDTQGNDVDMMPADVLVLEDKIGLVTVTELLHVFPADFRQLAVGQHVVGMRIEGDVYDRLLGAVMVRHPFEKLPHGFIRTEAPVFGIAEEMCRKDFCPAFIDLVLIVGQCAVQVLTHADPGYHVRRVFGKVRQSGGSAPRVQG